MHHPPVSNKVPGTLFVPAETQKDKNLQLKDLSKFCKPELDEMLERQVKLLSNKSRLSKLPDKGKKIQEVHDKIVEELKKRSDINHVAELFSDLNIASKGKAAINSLEWNGRYDKTEDPVTVDSDAEENVDPLKIIAQSQRGEKIVKIEKPQSSLITENDLNEINSFKNDNTSSLTLSAASSQQSLSTEVELDPHVNYVCSKESTKTATQKFKPYYTTKTNVHDPENEMKKKQSLKWENTSATPPLLQHPGAKVLSLHESIELQLRQKLLLKEIEEQRANERLKAKESRFHERLREMEVYNEQPDAIKLFNDYRNKKDDDLDSDDDLDDDKQLVDSDDEVHDECDVEPKGGVVNVLY